MRPSDLIDLALLGVLSEGPSPAPVLVQVVRRLCAPGFVPTVEVVETRIDTLLSSGDVIAQKGGPLTLTARGEGRIPELLCVAGPSPAEALGAACHRLRICLLELLPETARERVLADMIGCHRRELDQAERALARCPARCRFVERCLLREVERWRSEIDWLEALASEGVPPSAWRLS